MIKRFLFLLLLLVAGCQAAAATPSDDEAKGTPVAPDTIVLPSGYEVVLTEGIAAEARAALTDASPAYLLLALAPANSSQTLAALTAAEIAVGEIVAQSVSWAAVSAENLLTLEQLVATGDVTSVMPMPAAAKIDMALDSAESGDIEVRLHAAPTEAQLAQLMTLMTIQDQSFGAINIVSGRVEANQLEQLAALSIIRSVVPLELSGNQ